MCKDIGGFGTEGSITVKSGRNTAKKVRKGLDSTKIICYIIYITSFLSHMGFESQTAAGLVIPRGGRFFSPKMVKKLLPRRMNIKKIFIDNPGKREYNF